MKTKHFDSREDAVAWIIRNQFGRRNLPPYVRTELALRLKESIAARAKERQAEYHGNQFENGLVQKSSQVQKGRTRAELAKLAGMSHDTLTKAEKLSKKADEKTKEKLRKGEITINKAYSDMLQEERKDELKTCTVCGRELTAEHFYDNRNQCTECRSAQHNVQVKPHARKR